MQREINSVHVFLEQRQYDICVFDQDRGYQAKNVSGNVKFEKKLISVRYRPGQPWINIKTCQRDQHGQMFSTKGEIILNFKEWHQLKQSCKRMDKLIKQPHINGKLNKADDREMASIQQEK